MIKHYKNEAITITWKPDKCIHSTRCFKGLKEVFNPAASPWINLEGADNERIMEQVAQCPSGALSAELNKKEASIDNETETSTTIEVMKNGPLMVYGKLIVKHSDGKETVKNKVTAFCRCGASGNKPFCDGSHIRVGFED